MTTPAPDPPRPADAPAVEPPSSFFVPDGDHFVSTELTRGPWDPGAQHAGPPSALIGRAIEACDGGAERVVGRITLEILRPVPIAPLTVRAEVVRPGRSVDLVEATLHQGDTELVRARAWRFLRFDVDHAADLSPPPPPPPGPDQGREVPFFETGADVGYHTGMQVRFVTGAFQERGPAVAWMRMRHPLLPDEEPSPLQRVLIAADSGNGVSMALDHLRYLSINTELSVHLYRLPEGEWVCLDARTILPGGSVGLADTALFDQRGGIGRSQQILLVAPRS